MARRKEQAAKMMLESTNEKESTPTQLEPELETSGHYPNGMPALTDAQRPASETHNHAGQELRNILPDPALNGRTREPPMMPKPWHLDPYNR